MSPEEQAALMFKYEKGEWVQVWDKKMTMGTQEDLIALIEQAFAEERAAQVLAAQIIAAGWVRPERDHVAEADELRKQVRG